MDFTTAIKTCFSKYVVWEGRAARSEFWYFALFGMLAIFAAVIIDAVLGSSSNGGLGIVYALTCLALFLPSMSVSVRRLHDTDRSGWWYWLPLVPLIGGIVLLVWFCQLGTIGRNDYGNDPLEHLPDDADGYQPAS